MTKKNKKAGKKSKPAADHSTEKTKNPSALNKVMDYLNKRIPSGIDHNSPTGKKPRGPGSK